MTEERAAVLIDNNYLRKEVLDVYNGKYNGKSGRFRLDYEKFSDLLCRDINASRLRTYIYDCQIKKRKTSSNP